MIRFKKIGVINFSGNVGKSTIANHMFIPRMPGAKLIEVETTNASAFDQSDAERFKGKQFEELIEAMARHESVIIDIGASNLEDLMKFMNRMAGSHHDFDLFVLPVMPDRKMHIDTIRTINALSKSGVDANRIRILFNKVDSDDAEDVASIFNSIFAVHFTDKNFTLHPDAVLFDNPVYDRLRSLNRNVSEMANDPTDYTAMRRNAKDDDAKDLANKMLAAQRLARSAQVNLDNAFAALIR